MPKQKNFYMLISDITSKTKNLEFLAPLENFFGFSVSDLPANNFWPLNWRSNLLGKWALLCGRVGVIFYERRWHHLGFGSDFLEKWNGSDVQDKNKNQHKNRIFLSINKKNLTSKPSSPSHGKARRHRKTSRWESKWHAMIHYEAIFKILILNNFKLTTSKIERSKQETYENTYKTWYIPILILLLIVSYSN